MMAPDPMDTPPADHGSDRYIEIDAPFGLEPEGEWWEAVTAEPCADCRANLFVKWGNTNRLRSDPMAWHLVVAHDDGCSRLRAEQR
jgi:hypothetical protein